MVSDPEPRESLFLLRQDSQMPFLEDESFLEESSSVLSLVAAGSGGSPEGDPGLDWLCFILSTHGFVLGGDAGLSPMSRFFLERVCSGSI